MKVVTTVKKESTSGRAEGTSSHEVGRDRSAKQKESTLGDRTTKKNETPKRNEDAERKMLDDIEKTMKSQFYQNIVPNEHRDRVGHIMRFLGYRMTTMQVWDAVNEIQKNVYLGGITHPKDDGPFCYQTNPDNAPHHHIMAYGLKLVVSIIDKPVSWAMPAEVEHVLLCGKDEPGMELHRYFDSTVDKIRRAVIRKYPVLVHCHMGMSRSVTMLAAYYLKYGLPIYRPGLIGMIDEIESLNTGPTKHVPKVEQVLEFLSDKRICIFPNFGFIKHLIDYEAYLKSKINAKK